MNAQFIHHVLAVRLYRLRADLQNTGYFLDALACRQKLKDLYFAACQAVRPGRTTFTARITGRILGLLRLRIWLRRGDTADRPGQFLKTEIRRETGDRAGAHHLEGLVPVGLQRQGNNAAPGRGLMDPAHRLDGVESRCRTVEDDDVRL